MSRYCLALLWVLIAVSALWADNVTMSDGSTFQNVDVHRYTPGEGFMARVPQDDGTMSDELYDIPVHLLKLLEFRKIDDLDVLPKGRPADMLTIDGQSFPGTQIEFARSTQSGLVLRVRQANTPGTAQAWDIPITQIQSLDFTAIPPIPTPAPPPGMENMVLPPSGTTPPTGDDYDDYDNYSGNFSGGSSSSSSGGDKELDLAELQGMDPEQLAAMMGVGIAVFIVIVIGAIAFEAALNGTVIWLISRHFNLGCSYLKSFLTGAAICVCTNIAFFVISDVLKLEGCTGCNLSFVAFMVITRLLISAILKQNKAVAWQMTMGILLVRILMCVGIVVILIAVVGASIAAFG